MSTPTPPDDPRRNDTDTWESLRKRYVDAVHQMEALRDAQAERVASLADIRVEPLAETMSRPTTQSQSSIAGWVTTAMQSVTLVTIVGCAFWLGSLSTTVSRTSQNLDKLNDAVVGVSRDSVSNRLIAIETKLENIDKKIGAEPAPNARTSDSHPSSLAAGQYPQIAAR